MTASRRLRWWYLPAAAVALLLLAAAALLAWNLRGESPVDDTPVAGSPDAEQARRGAYLALAGNCAGCHTARGGAPYAGGTGIETPFGTVYASNLTPDAATGLGAWNASQFWRAMHNGRSRDGRLLYPAFPYPNYTRITRADSDALFAYLRTLAPVSRPATPHALRAPYDTQLALAVWRALYFRPGASAEDSAGATDPERRGAYLVNALGHCNACHSSRNWLGATVDALDLSGGLIPMQNWYAPSLVARDEAGVGHWSIDEIVTLLGTGRTDRASTLGPMADVVFRSTQHLTRDDLTAIATHLKSLPTVAAETIRPSARVSADDLARGDRLYERHCANCHGADGAGVAGAYPPLAGNRAVTLASPANLVRVVLGGGFAPATAGNPRPFGMPPFATVLDDGDLATLLTMIRNRWGNEASPVGEAEVRRLR